MLGLLACLVTLAAAAKPKTPNIVVMIADDLGLGDVGAYGSPSGRTDAWDRMAALGAKSTNFLVTQAVCSASRASLVREHGVGNWMTGRLPVGTGAYTNETWPLDLIFRVFIPPNTGCVPTSVPMLAEELKKLGYYTAMIGKWHMGSNYAQNCTPAQRGFDDYMGLLWSHEEGFPGEGPEDVVFTPMSLSYKTSLLEQPVDLRTLTKRYTQRALDIIQAINPNASNPQKVTDAPLPPLHPRPVEDQPLFLWMAYEEPHVPLIASKDFMNTSRRGPYGDSVREMDWSVATILARLEEVGMDENTVVIALSDNGAWLQPSNGFPGSKGDPRVGGSNNGRRGGKGSTWEGGFNVPFIVYAPGKIPAGQVVHEPISGVDLFPTLMALATNNEDDPNYNLFSALYPSSPTPPKSSFPQFMGRNVWPWLNGSWSEGGSGDPTRKNGFAPLSSLPKPGAKPPQIHEWIPYWRNSVLYAFRMGPWKAHFFTRDGFGPDPPTPHDPPLLFNLDWDYGEAYPLNTTEPPYDAILNTIVATAKKHNSTVQKVPSQYEALDFGIMPCCNKTYDVDEAIHFLEQGEIGLALWDSCVCNNNTDATTRISWGNVTWWN